jgi:hypothetical protein
MFTLRGSCLTAVGSFVLVLGAGVVSATPSGKVTICHEGSNISVSENAVPAHLAHGDTVGACNGNGLCPCPTIVDPVTWHVERPDLHQPVRRRVR